MKIVIVDYGMGNLRSVEKAFEKNGAKPVVSSKPSDILSADKIVLPGVGAFTSAVLELKKRKLINPILKQIDRGTPYLGLCLGLQLLFETSEENVGKKMVKGFGVLKGTVKRFGTSLKVPQMGWNQIKILQKNCQLLKGISTGEYFYFVHSYYAAPKDKSVVLATTQYGTDYCSAVWKNNIYATQFHPEKSQGKGLQVIGNFIKL